MEEELRELLPVIEPVETCNKIVSILLNLEDDLKFAFDLMMERK